VRDVRQRVWASLAHMGGLMSHRDADRSRARDAIVVEHWLCTEPYCVGRAYFALGG
jgi:hypothetical protein